MLHEFTATDAVLHQPATEGMCDHLYVNNTRISVITRGCHPLRALVPGVQWTGSVDRHVGSGDNGKAVEQTISRMLPMSAS